MGGEADLELCPQLPTESWNSVGEEVVTVGAKAKQTRLNPDS